MSAVQLEILLAAGGTQVEYLRGLVDSEPDLRVAASAYRWSEVLDHVRVQPPAVAVVDFGVSPVDVIRSVHAVRHLHANTPIVVVARSMGDDLLLPALYAGASAFVLLGRAEIELVPAIRALLQGASGLRPQPSEDPANAWGVHATGRVELAHPTGWTSIAFTDIEDSSSLFSSLGDRAATKLIREHDRLLQARIKARGGRVLKHRGDGVMAEFRSPDAAVRCALEIDSSVEEWAAPIKVRIGIHTGEAVRQRRDLFGAAVITAARISDNAAGGQILASDITKALAGPVPATFREVGFHQLKGIPDPAWLFEVKQQR